MIESVSSSLKNSLSSVPSKALNFSSRMILSYNLDYKQILPSGQGFARDYRGLAELMGFQYRIIKRFEECDSPTMKILESWEIRREATLDKLITYLEEMDRHDVISELTPHLEKNVEVFLNHQRSLENQLQIAEVCSNELQMHKNVLIFVGDISAEEIQAIVNAANTNFKRIGGESNVEVFSQHQRSLHKQFTKKRNVEVFSQQQRSLESRVEEVYSEHRSFLIRQAEEFFSQYHRSLESPVQINEENREAISLQLKKSADSQYQAAEGALRKIRRKFLYLNLSFKEKSSTKSECVKIDDIKPWPVYAKSKKLQLHQKVSIYVGDITSLAIDAIVNAANTYLAGGDLDSVDGAIHRAAGPRLLEECERLNGCDIGDAKLTLGYELPAKYVIHTVGPCYGGNMMDVKKELLASCYRKSLSVAMEKNVRTIAFPCISTGTYAYPKEEAAQVAISTVRDVLEKKESSFDRIIFCLFLPDDVGIYEGLLQEYFPV